MYVTGSDIVIGSEPAQQVEPDEEAENVGQDVKATEVEANIAREADEADEAKVGLEIK